MSGGVNDHLALSEEERQRLRDFVSAAAEFERRRGAGLVTQSRLLVRAAEHIGVLDNRIANLSREYRAIEKSAEQLAARAWAEGAAAEHGALNPYEAP
jgi:hypothetical protein